MQHQHNRLEKVNGLTSNETDKDIETLKQYIQPDFQEKLLAHHLERWAKQSSVKLVLAMFEATNHIGKGQQTGSAFGGFVAAVETLAKSVKECRNTIPQAKHYGLDGVNGEESK